MKCLLCDSDAVADGLCTPCGAKTWAAQITSLLGAATKMPPEWQEERANAIRGLTPKAAREFLDKLEAARKAHESAPLCSRGCTSHDDKEESR